MNRNGQNTIEYLLMLGILTLIGAWIMKGFIGPSGESGSVRAMQQDATTKIVNDQ